MKHENIDEQAVLALTIKVNKNVKNLDLHSWLSKWLVQDYEIVIDRGCWWLPAATFMLRIPLKQIKPSKLNDVIDCSSSNSYPQTKTGSDFELIDKELIK